ncbi:MAG: hypothetical protein WB678_04635 [Stellaceae bacterium]
MPPALDTLQISKRLKEAGFTEPQAKAVTTVLRDAREADFSLLSTKADLNVLREATKADLNALREATKADSDRLHAEFEALRKEIGAKLEILRRDLTIRLGSMIVIATGVLLAAKFFG